MLKRLGRPLSLVVLGSVVGSSSFARGEPRVDHGPESSLEVRERLPDLPKFRLTLPIVPKRFAFSTHAQNRVDMSTTLWEAEANWFAWNNVSLFTTSGVREGLELDCRLLCEPFIERSLGTELRLSPNGAVEDHRSYLFGSGDLVFVTGRRFTRWELGFGGSL